jgi:nucleolar GTP-binding protein
MFGFPNVGKSTILSKLTDSKPKIANYAFTTKDINVGYIKIRQSKIQVLDTPGTLNRFENMNDIEKIAHLSIKHLADLVIYVFDPTLTYSLEEQIMLFESIKIKNNYVCLLSKKDLVNKELVESFNKQFGCIEIEELENVFKELILDEEKEILKCSKNIK